MSPVSDKENMVPKVNNETIKEAPGLTLGDNENAENSSGENTLRTQNKKKVKSPSARRRLDMGWSLLAEFNAQDLPDLQPQQQPSYNNYTLGLPVNGTHSSSSNDGHKHRNFNNHHNHHQHHHPPPNHHWGYYNNTHTQNMLTSHHGSNPAAYNPGLRDDYGYYGAPSAYGQTHSHHQQHYGHGAMYRNDDGNNDHHNNFPGKMHVPLTRMFGGGYHGYAPNFGWSDGLGDEPVPLEKPLETKIQPVVGRLYHQQLYKRGMMVLEQLNKIPEFSTIPGRRVPPSVQDYMAMEAITNKLSGNYDGLENPTEDLEEARNKNFLNPSPPTTPASELFQSKPSSIDGSTTAGADQCLTSPYTTPSLPGVSEVKF